MSKEHMMSRKQRRALAKESGVPFKPVQAYDGARDERWQRESNMKRRGDLP